jgi:hypothetical protein
MSIMFPFIANVLNSFIMLIRDPPCWGYGLDRAWIFETSPQRSTPSNVYWLQKVLPVLAGLTAGQCL